MLQIIGGEFKSQKISQPKNSKTRPISQKVRAAIFDVLGSNIKNANVADLFAGSGAIGIESLSRGAYKSVFVENNPQALRSIRNNIKILQLEPRSIVMPLHVEKYINSASELFDVIFVDPPYKDFNIELVKLIGNLLKSTGVIVASCSSKTKVTGLEPEYKIAQHKIYGDTQIIYIEREPQ